jgi:hypothetical protein
MEYKLIQASFRQKITVGRKELFDGLEVFVGGEVVPDPGQSPEAALIELAVVLKNHLEKEFQLAAQKPSLGVQSLVDAKEAKMAPQAGPVQAPVFTQKPKNFVCTGGCGTPVELNGRRCMTCFKVWLQTPEGQVWAKAHPRRN